MNPIVIAAISIVLVLLLPRILKFIAKNARIYKYGSKIPGPRALPIIGNALDIPLNIEDWGPHFDKCVKEEMAKGNNVMRLWVAHNLKVFPLTGKALQELLDSQEEITKADDYDVIQPWLGLGLITSTDDKWRARRKMLTPTFHYAMLDGYVETMDREARLMTEILEPFAENGTQVDMFTRIKRCALDVICQTAMGFELNSQRNMSHPYAKAVDDMGVALMIYNMQPWMWFPPIWYLSGWANQYNSVLKTLTDFTNKVIKDRVEALASGEEPEERNGRKAFLDMLLEMREVNSLSDEDLREEVDTFMFGGHDTTASGTSWTLWCLATHPEAQEKVSAEIEEIFGDSDREITADDLKKMQYLDRVIKEAMRINPPVAFMGRNLKNDFKIDGYTVAKGTQVYISPLLIHRNPEIFPDPYRFDPDRFLPENAKQRHAYDYIPFSAGPRNCIGQKFASYQEKMMTAWMIRKFKLTTDKKFLDNRGCPEMVMRPSLGVPIRLERRQF